MSSVRCGCCEGRSGRAPRVWNRPGLSALHYRIGTHGTFLDAMLAGLSSGDRPALRRLTTRDTADPAIALLDAWAVVADVLTFYQERIANEGYLRTAVERRSVLELARLVGYELRPGVVASVFLAYSLESGHQVTVPAGSRAQSTPGPGELPQAFETSEPLVARDLWNELKVRAGRPQVVTSANVATLPVLYLAGTATNLKRNDALLFTLPGPQRALRFVEAVDVDDVASRTTVTLQGGTKPAPKVTATTDVDQILSGLLKPASRPPANLFRLRRSAADVLSSTSDTIPRLAAATRPQAAKALYQGWGSAKVTPAPDVTVHAFRVVASLFGHNAPPPPVVPSIPGLAEPAVEEGAAGAAGAAVVLTPDWPSAVDEQPGTLFLDNAYDAILPGTHVAVRRAGQGPVVFSDIRVSTHSRLAYGMGGKTTEITLAAGDAWRKANEPVPIRQTVVYAQSEPLALADAPIADDVCGADHELDRLYDGLEAGRWLTVSGMRTDLPGGAEVPATELVMLAEVRQDTATVKAAHPVPGPTPATPEPTAPLPGDKVHTFLRLAGDGLSYCYRRDTVRMRANVVHATHGETRQQVLGSGDASQPQQRFQLRQGPLTYVSAPTTSGIDSSLAVRVDDVLWHEHRSTAELGPTDRGYVVRIDDAGGTEVIFGNGERGARPPTGAENIRATFRTGIGAPGNVAEGQISLLATKPLGVKEVVNPLPATGGADPESRDQARGNAPLAVKALDRLVSVQDYEDFARLFAGVGKASAARLSDGARQLVHVTIAGAGDIPIGPDSDLLANLRRALLAFGDPWQPVKVEVRERLTLVISARVALLPDFEWEGVAPRIRSAVGAAFGFDRRTLGEHATSSELLAVVHRVPGVAWVDLDLFDAVAEGTSVADLARLADPDNPAHLRKRDRVVAALARNRPPPIKPAQLAIFDPAVPETLILQERRP